MSKNPIEYLPHFDIIGAVYNTDGKLNRMSVESPEGRVYAVHVESVEEVE